MSIKIKTGHARIKMPDGTYQDLSGFSLGASDTPEKEWVLKGTIDAGNKDSGINVDLSGCTELVITGYTNATAETSMYCMIRGKKTNIISNISGNGYRLFFAEFDDNNFGVFGDGKFATAAGATALGSALGCFDLLGTSVAELTSIHYTTPGSITNCSVTIYAR